MNNYRNVAQYRLFCSFNPERFSNHICIVNYNIVNLQNRTYAKGKDKKKEKGFFDTFYNTNFRILLL